VNRTTEDQVNRAVALSLHPFSAIWTIARKDWLIEGRAKDVLTATLFFAAMVVIIQVFAFGPSNVGSKEFATALRQAAPGVLWVAVAFASILAANRAFASEAEDGALEALLAYPVPAEFLYMGKLLANLGLMLILAAIVTPITIFLYNLPVGANWPLLILTVFLGTAGFSIVSTFFSALTVNLRAREALLPIIVFPLVVAVVLGAVNATVAIVTLAPADEVWKWLRLLIGFDVVLVTACTLVFPFAVES
jgi:heme exporter protein B